MATETEPSTLEWRLLDDFQRGFPLTATPFADIAEDLGVDEDTVLEALGGLMARGLIQRIGPVFGPGRIGASTLAAMAVPVARMDEVAAFVSAYPEVNHNYEREDEFNLWFVAAGESAARIDAVLADVASKTGLTVMNLPLEESYHIDLGFPLCRAPRR